MEFRFTCGAVKNLNDITSRVEGHGCPYCSGLLAIPGENDLATLYPEIAAQWNREKNGDKVPEQFLPMSACKV